MVAAAETLLDVAPTSTDFLLWEQEQPSAAEIVQTVPSLELDTAVREQAARFVGRVASGAVLEASSETPMTTSLLEALHRAHAGEAEARRLVEMNVRTDVIERTIKAGHVMKVDLAVNEHGQVLQHGQTAEAIQANSLRYAANSWQMRERTVAETRNMFRIETLHRQRLLEDNNFVVISRAADNMTLGAAAKVGFFTDTMSCAIQVTTTEGQGLTTESAFVAGKAHANASRHDAETVVRFGRVLNVELAGKTAAQLIDTPLLVPKRMMPNGVIDLARLLDDAGGGLFFGQAVPRQDYLDFLQQCRQREADLEPTVQTIVAALIAEAPGIHTPVQATLRLGKLSGAHMLKRAVVDTRIDGLAFGLESAAYLEAARYAYQQGDFQLMESFLEKSIATETSSSCPGAGQEAGGNESGEDGEDGDCYFISKQCPLCGAKNVKTLVRKQTDGKKHISGSCGCKKVM